MAKASEGRTGGDGRNPREGPRAESMHLSPLRHPGLKARSGRRRRFYSAPSCGGGASPRAAAATNDEALRQRAGDSAARVHDVRRCHALGGRGAVAPRGARWGWRGAAGAEWRRGAEWGRRGEGALAGDNLAERGSSQRRGLLRASKNRPPSPCRHGREPERGEAESEGGAADGVV